MEIYFFFIRYDFSLVFLNLAVIFSVKRQAGRAYSEIIFLIKLAKFVGVNTIEVQWKGLVAKEPPSWPRLGQMIQRHVHKTTPLDSSCPINQLIDMLAAETRAQKTRKQCDVSTTSPASGNGNEEKADFQHK